MEVSALKSEIIDLIEKTKVYVEKIAVIPINKEDDLLIEEIFKSLDEKKVKRLL